jgi:hypothetical protein
MRVNHSDDSLGSSQLFPSGSGSVRNFYIRIMESTSRVCFYRKPLFEFGQFQNFGESELGFHALRVDSGFDLAKHRTIKDSRIRKAENGPLFSSAFWGFTGTKELYVSVFDILELSQFHLYPFKAYKLLEA